MDKPTRDKLYYIKNKTRIDDRKRAWYIKNKERLIKKAALYYQRNKEICIERMREWVNRNKERSRGIKEGWAERNRAIYLTMHRARAKVQNAVRKRTIVKPTCCSNCSETVKIEAHHHKGYERTHWLDVIWLCRKCHEATHHPVKP